MKTVIEMAREVGAGEPESLYGRTDYVVMTKFELERFAELVRAAEREQGQKWFDAVTAQHKQAILAEREACAKVCDDAFSSSIVGNVIRRNLAAAIRARGLA